MSCIMVQLLCGRYSRADFDCRSSRTLGAQAVKRHDGSVYLGKAFGDGCYDRGYLLTIWAPVKQLDQR